jgi:hypothetical protein
MEIDQTLPFRRIFKFLDLGTAAITRLLPKFHQLRFDLSDKHRKQWTGNRTTKLIKSLDFLAKGEQMQSFFPVITGEPHTVNVLRMINQRERLKAEEGKGEQ